MSRSGCGSACWKRFCELGKRRKDLPRSTDLKTKHHASEHITRPLTADQKRALLVLCQAVEDPARFWRVMAVPLCVSRAVLEQVNCWRFDLRGVITTRCRVLPVGDVSSAFHLGTQLER